MLDDILDFGCNMLVDDGRLCMWMPTANDEETELAIPSHPAMELVSISVQQFNKCMSRGEIKHMHLFPFPFRFFFDGQKTHITRQLR